MKLTRGFGLRGFRKGSMRFHTTPEDLASGGAASGFGSDKEDSELLADMKKYQSEKPEAIVAEIKKLRHEAKTRRLEGQSAKAERDEVKATLLEKELENQTLKAKVQEQENAQLAKEKKYEELWRNSETEKVTLVKQKDESLININIKAKALELGIHEDMIPLLSKDGITVDSAGRVLGIDVAFARLAEKHSSLIEALKTSKTSSGSAGADNQAGSGNGSSAGGESSNPADHMIIPGTSMTYGQLKTLEKKGLANSGSPPPANQGKPDAKPDFTKMTKKEQAEWYAKWKKKRG